MKEEKYFELDEIKQIRLNWDFENVIFPRSVIKKFSYNYDSEKNKCFHKLYLSECYLEVDLDYVLNEYSYFENQKSDDKKNIDCLKYNYVWYISVTTNDDKEYELELPFYSKNLYLDENTTMFNDKNLFEQHEQKEDSYIIKWSKDKEKTKLTIEEMILLFKNTKKIGIPITNKKFQIDVLKHLLNEKEENERFKFLSIRELLNEEIGDNYKMLVVSKDEEHFSSVSLNINSKLKNGSVHYVFIKEIKNYQNLFEFLYLINKNKDFGKTIFILNDNINLDNFYKEISENLNDKKITKNMICINIDKMNQIWFELVKNEEL